MYSIRLSNQAEKELDRIPDKDYLRISSKIKSLGKNPRPVGHIKLSQINGYRIRIGNYRILYEIDDSKKTISIYKIAHRKEAYR
jgi:mRNA interferase RelE/StbE